MTRVAFWAIAFLPGVLSQAISLAFCTVNSLSWTSNSLGESPCDVAADLAAVCNGGEFTLDPLDPGYLYLGPSKLVANSCRCSSVYYSMLSACAACQGNSWLDWSEYDVNCTTVYPGVFPQGIPAGTRVPGWAYADIRITNGFNVTVAQSLDTRPESTGLPSATPTFTTRSAPTFGNPTFTLDGGPSFASFPTGSSSSASSHAGAIAGGTIGGVVGLSLIAGLGFFYFRRRQGGIGIQPASSAFDTTAYTPAPYNPDPTPNMSYNPDPNNPYVTSQTSQPQGPYDPTFPATPVPVPSSPFTSYSPPPASTTYTSFQGSTPQVAQPLIPAAPTGHYTGAPEV